MQRTLIRGVENCLQTEKLTSALLSNHVIRTSSHTGNSVVNDSTRRTNTELWSTVLGLGGANTEFIPDGYALAHLVRASTELGSDSYCQQLHSYATKSGFVSDVFVATALIGFYRKTDSMGDAHRMFVEIPQPSVVSWNSLISGYVHTGRYREALSLFLELDRASEVYADAYSFSAALSACGQLGVLQLGASIHSKIFKCGLEGGVVVANCLIDIYGKCGSVEDAIRVFEEMIDKDLFSWNSIIAATARNGYLELAFDFFYQLSNPDKISYNELIEGIAQFGDIGDAVKILWNMPNPSSSTWNSILTGYVDRNRAPEALDFLSKMQSKNVKMDEYTFSIILRGIADVSALTWGMLIHCCTVKQGLSASVVIASALIDMYSKCGRVKDAESVFGLLPTRNLVTWNTMINGYARNGDSSKVIQLFEQLKLVRDLKPDGTSFLNVLAACSHNEVPLDTATQYFESMRRDYSIEPTVMHCCSMVRLLGQRGEVWRAKRMIYELGLGSYGAVWRALLGACGACRELEVAEISAAKMIELEGDNDFVYVMMSNIFACHGRWRDVSVLRKYMRERGLRKEAGRSWIEVENVTSYSSITKVTGCMLDK